MPKRKKSIIIIVASLFLLAIAYVVALKTSNYGYLCSILMDKFFDVEKPIVSDIVSDLVYEKPIVSDLVYLENNNLNFSKARIDVEKYFSGTLKIKEKVLVEKKNHESIVAVYQEDSLLELRKDVYANGKMVEHSILKSQVQDYSSVEFFSYKDSLLGHSYKCTLEDGKCKDTLNEVLYVFDKNGKILSYLHRSREVYNENFTHLSQENYFDSSLYRVEYNELGMLKHAFSSCHVSTTYDESGYESEYKDDEVDFLCDSTGNECSIKRGLFKLGSLNYQRNEDSMLVNLEFPDIRRKINVTYDKGLIQQETSLIQRGMDKDIWQRSYNYDENGNVILFKDSSIYGLRITNATYDSLQRPVKINHDVFDLHWSREIPASREIYTYTYLE